MLLMLLLMLKLMLLLKGNQRIVVVNIPWYL